jgi:hypothetical protein
LTRLLSHPVAVNRGMEYLRKLVRLAFRLPATLHNVVGTIDHTQKEAAMKKTNSDKQFICRDKKETEAYVRNKREDSKFTREYVQKLTEKVVRDHRPALDWLADK